MVSSLINEFVKEKEFIFMKKATKIIIGVVITIFLIIGLIVGGVVSGFFTLVFFADREVQKGAEKRKQARITGREFGRTTDENGCIEKGLSLKREIDKFDKVIFEFVGECLQSSEPTPNFCEGVPKEAHYDFWINNQCEKVSKDAPCFDTMYEKQSYCKFFQKRNQANIDGREFGKTTDWNGCLEKGLTLPNDLINKSSFTSGCLRTSRPTPDFCEGVPGYDQKWAGEQCKKAGDNTDSCIQAFDAKRSFCR
jgi:hypothetical protein